MSIARLRPRSVRARARSAPAGKPQPTGWPWVAGFAAHPGEDARSFLLRLIAHDREHARRSRYGGPG